MIKCFSVVSEHIRRQNVAENEVNSNEKILKIVYF